MKLMKRISVRLASLLAVCVSFAGCESGDPYVKEQNAITQYMKDKGLTGTPLASGLYYIETKAGTGSTPAYGAKVRVKYTGTFTDSSVFDSGTFDFNVGMGRVIKGWDEGIALMKVGGKAILIVPSDLGYGPNGYSDIPGYTPLIFTVELIAIL